MPDGDSGLHCNPRKPLGFKLSPVRGTTAFYPTLKGAELLQFRLSSVRLGGTRKLTP